MPAALPEDVREAIAEAVKAGGTCRGVAREFDVSPSTVRKIAGEYGITDAFSRAATENATRAKTADLAARRAALAEALLEDADHFRRRARASYTQHLTTRDEVHAIVMEEPPGSEVKHLMGSVGLAVDRHLTLVKHDATDAGTSAVDQWLAHMLGAAAAADE